MISEAVGIRHHVKHRNKRHIPRGYSGLPVTKERRLLDIYVNKHLKGYVNNLPKFHDYKDGDDKKSRLPNTESRLPNTENSTRNEDNKRSEIPRPPDGAEKRHFVEKTDIQRVKWYTATTSDNRETTIVGERGPNNDESVSNGVFMKPQEVGTTEDGRPGDWDRKKMDRIPSTTHARDDESWGFQPRPVGDDEEFNNKVNQLK